MPDIYGMRFDLTRYYYGLTTAVNLHASKCQDQYRMHSYKPQYIIHYIAQPYILLCCAYQMFGVIIIRA